jgi:hypothetical protein
MTRLNLDLPIIMATVMYASFFVVTANALVGMVYIVLDRVRTRGQAMASCSACRISGLLPHRARCGARRRRCVVRCRRSEILGVVSESGSGKTVSCSASSA